MEIIGQPYTTFFPFALSDCEEAGLPAYGEGSRVHLPQPWDLGQRYVLTRGHNYSQEAVVHSDLCT